MLEREEIYRACGATRGCAGDGLVDVFVRKLRLKLERASPRWRYIHTHFGIGYRFAAESLSTASSPGSTSTTASCSWSKTTRCRFWSAKFCSIYTTNLDEFYMVRVAGLQDQIEAGADRRPGRQRPDDVGLIREKVLGQGERLTDCFERRLRPRLADHDIEIVSVGDLIEEHRRAPARHFQR